MGPTYQILEPSCSSTRETRKKERKWEGGSGKVYTLDWSHSIAESRLRHECGSERIIHIEDFAISAALRSGT